MVFGGERLGKLVATQIFPDEERVDTGKITTDERIPQFVARNVRGFEACAHVGSAVVNQVWFVFDLPIGVSVGIRRVGIR